MNLHEIAPASTSSYSKFTVPPVSNGLRAIAACNQAPLWATVGTIPSHRDSLQGSCLLWRLRFQILYVLLVLAHDRRRIVHFNVTAHPTAEWTAQQLREACPFDQIPRCLLRDRDGIFGCEFRKEVKAMGIQEVLSAPRSPGQRAYIKRGIGTVRRECVDHAIVFNEASLYPDVTSFVGYYHESRTHLSLARDAPEPRPVQAPQPGRIVAIPQVGGLHQR